MLIKREIKDNIAFLLVTISFSLILAVFMVSMTLQSDTLIDLIIYDTGVYIVVFLILAINFSAMGITQMYLDRTRRISAYLSTLSVNRNQILIARIITGILTIFVFFVPIFITGAYQASVLNGPIPTYPTLLIKMFFISFLISFACYCIGLQTGWNSGMIAPIFGGIFLSCIFVTLVLIKGFYSEIIALLLIFIIAILINIRCTFKTKSL